MAEPARGSHCPSPEVLRRFALGAMRPNDVERVALHLAGSPTCRCHATLSACESDSDWLIEALRSPATRQPASDDEQVCENESPHTTAVRDPERTREPGRERAIPERIGGYRILGRVGRGGMGEVYRGFDERLQRDVAIKAVPCSSTADTGRDLRFAGEAIAAAKLSHPHIVPVHEAGVADGYQFIAMKLVDGQSLAAAAADGGMPQEESARLLRDVARALHYAHQRSLIHRDVKPSNILVDPSGWAFVTDFGLAKQLDAKGDQTSTGAILGTPSYMAPEQAAGLNDEITTAADVYGLGGVLYFLLAGRPPFAATTSLETCRQVVDCDPLPPGRVRDDVDRDLETICLKCLAKRPQDRYDSAAEVADDLSRWLDGKPIRARPRSRTERMWRWCCRRPAVAALSLLAVTATALLAVGSPWVAVSLHAEKTIASRQRQLAERRADLATRRLFDARLAQARAERRGIRPDRRAVCLEAVRDAVAAAAEIELDAGLLRDLRNEAIAAFALPDLHVDRSYSIDAKSHAVDPDVEYFAFHDRSRRCLIVRRIDDGQEIAQLPADDVTRADTIVSRGGRFVAFARPKNARLASFAVWNTSEADVCFRTPPDYEWSNAGFSPSGDRFIVTDPAGVVRVYDSATGTVLREIETNRTNARDMHHPTKTWVALLADGRITTYDYESGEQVSDFRAASGGGVSMFQWSPTGMQVAAAVGPTVDLFDADGRREQSLRGHQHYCVVGFFDSTGRLFASGSWDGTARLWDLTSGHTRARFEGAIPVGGSFKNPWLAMTVVERGQLRLDRWVVRESPELRIVGSRRARPYGLAASSDDRHLFVAAVSGIQVIDLATATEIQWVPLPNVIRVAWDRHANRVIATTSHAVFAMQRQAADSPLLGEPELLHAILDGVHPGLDVSRNGDHLIAPLTARRIAWHDLRSGERREIETPIGRRSQIAVRHDGQLVATVDEHMLHVVEVKSADRVASLPTPDSYIALAFSPAGDLLVAGTEREYLVWETDDWQLLYRKPRSRSSVWGAVDFSPDGRTMAIAHDRFTVGLIDGRSGSDLCTLFVPEPRPDVHDLMFSEGGDRLIVAGNNHQVLIWDLSRIQAELARLKLAW